MAGGSLRSADDVGFKIFDSSFNTRLTVTSAGNIGIGTTSPTNRLQVNGTAGLNNSITSFDSSDFVRIYAEGRFLKSDKFIKI